MSKLFDRVAVAGVGLIGGSLSLAARTAGLVGERVGLGRTQANLDVALERGLVDRVTRDPRQAVRDADLVLLAVPVATMAPLVREMRDSLRPGAVVTDVGSVKARVVTEVERELPRGVAFVGAHPIAGTEDSGAAAARIDLFRGTRCVMTPSAASSPEAVTRLRGLWEGVGAQVYEMAPERHDEILAWVSHVPHLLAFALMGGCPPEALAFAGPSFRDATRVAASDPGMWRDILLYNAGAIGSALDATEAALARLRAGVERGDAESLIDLITAARAARRGVRSE